MPYILGKQSRSKLIGVHPDLILLAGYAIQHSEVDFGITEGVRDLVRQQYLIDTGASSLKNPESSRHVPSEITGLGHAIDVVAYLPNEAGKLKVSWHGPLYYKIAESFKEGSKILRIPIEWGGDWSSFFDGPHFQLPKRNYK